VRPITRSMGDYSVSSVCNLAIQTLNACRFSKSSILAFETISTPATRPAWGPLPAPITTFSSQHPHLGEPLTSFDSAWRSRLSRQRLVATLQCDVRNPSRIAGRLGTACWTVPDARMAFCAEIRRFQLLCQEIGEITDFYAQNPSAKSCYF
jgi:hypothetical protein